MFTQNRYLQEMLVDGGKTLLLELIKEREKNFHLQTWHAPRDCVVPYSCDESGTVSRARTQTQVVLV